jgi:hypothetical protein
MVGEELLGLARLPDVVVVRGLLGAGGVTEGEGDHDERDPPPDGLLAVLGAPAAHATGERVGVHLEGSLREVSRPVGDGSSVGLGRSPQPCGSQASSEGR